MRLRERFISLATVLTMLLSVVPSVFADGTSAEIACGKIRMFQGGMYVAGTIVVGRGRTTYLNFTAPEGDYESVTLNLRREKGQAWGQTEDGEKEYDKAYYRIISPESEDGVNAEPRDYTEITLNGSGTEDQKIDITAAVEIYLSATGASDFAVELAGYYEVNKYKDNGAWEGDEKYCYCVFDGVDASKSTYTAPVSDESELMTDYIPFITSEEVAAGDTTFTHPGILFNKTMLDTMVKKIRAKENPWYADYEKMIATNEASLNPLVYIDADESTYMEIGDGIESSSPEKTIMNYTRIDADTALSQAVMYIITGNTAFRKNSLDIIKSFGSMKSLGLVYDEQIGYSLITYKLCAAAEILKYSSTEDKSLEWNDEYNGYMQSFLNLTRSKWDRNYHWMNQHLMGVLAQTAVGIFNNDETIYKTAVLRGTANTDLCTIEGCDHRSADCPLTRSGAIKYLFREVLYNEETGEPVEPNIQLIEMGRDQGHSYCDVAAASIFAMMTWIQDTKVDNETGAVSDDENAVYIWDYLDERIVKTINLCYKYNFGYDITWIPVYQSESKGIYTGINKQYTSVGNIDDVGGLAYIYYRYYLGRDDMDTNEDTKYLSMARAAKYPEGNNQDWIGWTDMFYTPEDADTAFTQMDAKHSVTIKSDNCTAQTEQTEAAFSELVKVNVTADEGYTLKDAYVAVNGEALDVNRDIEYSGDEKQATLVFGMPQADAEVVITPVKLPRYYDDVAYSAWYYDGVTAAYERGIMNGVSDKEFEPDGTFSRAMLAAVLYRLAGEPETAGDISFADVPASAWYHNAVVWAAENEITAGVSDTEFAPDAAITRQDFAVMLMRYSDTEKTYELSDEFTDKDSVSDYAVSAMAWAVGEGIINGVTDTELAPKDTVTRAQAAVMLARLK